MSTIRLGLRENRISFAPGEVIAGAVDWELQAVPKKAEVRLGWTTVGKGTTDSQIVDRVVFQELRATDLRTFEFTAPAEPYSFSGKLVSLVWNVELVLQPKDLRERHEIVIAPGGHEVLLPGVADA
ncbi:MAG TPA: hypothetical protein VGO11_25120 [Chthoniobacteraceae bacterium]|jgi:hypothetical protein|nr:hypothetical protein [Chthoniobacteraceae bacterium]